ncbi:MAG: lysophospholipid acyltransferase family protein [Noviherbaspirillum sp.]
MIALHLLRVLLHLVQGLATCALVFPLAGLAMRERRIRNWSRSLLSICGVRLVLRGELSDSPGLIVCNHISWLDIFAVNTCRPCRFVAKSDIRDWPLLGWLADRAGTIFIARGRQRDVRRIFQGLVHSIHAGERVAFFPEGTTSTQGTVLPFHANLFEAAIDADVPVQPYALRYLDRSGRPHPAVEYIGDTTFVQSMLTILRHRDITAELLLLPAIPSAGGHRRELAAAAHDAIAGALGETRVDA